MTIVEVVATVVVMGLIIGPLSMTLVQAITLVPDASEREVTSTESANVLEIFSHDASNATLGISTITQNPTTLVWDYNDVIGQPTPSWNFDSTGIEWCPAASATRDFAIWGWNDIAFTPQVTYGANWRTVYTPAANGLMRMQLQRQSSVSGVLSGYATHLDRYCKPGTVSIILTTRAVGTTATIALYVGTADSDGRQLANIEMQASMRTF